MGGPSTKHDTVNIGAKESEPELSPKEDKRNTESRETAHFRLTFSSHEHFAEAGHEGEKRRSMSNPNKGNGRSF